MGTERLRDLVAYPLLVLGVILTLLGLSPILSAVAIMAGMMPKPETMQISGMFVSAAFFLATGLPSLAAFFLRARQKANLVAQIAGIILLIYALLFPFTLAINVPFFIPLSFYLCGATGIWVLLRNR